MTNKHKPMHGTAKAAGCSHARLGNFCKLFPDLPSWADDCGGVSQCDAEAMAAALGGPGGLMHDAGNSSGDSGIPAGYTFFSQFVDHDITLDTTSNLHGAPQTNSAINELPNLRSASLDLDCIYGLGPEAMPFMYDQTQPGRMLTGSEVDGIANPLDVPRNEEGRALIGDPRNDENIFVSQLQLLFLRFHNKRMIGANFEEAQLDCRFHYQHIVLYDLLKRVCDPDIYDFAVPKIEFNAGQEAEDRDYPFCNIVDHCHRICMPVEFSVAAYRFGHTMVRSAYPANEEYPVIELFDERFGTLGFGQVPPELTIDWRYLLEVERCHPYAKSKALDHLLADELIRMPDPVVGRNAPANDRSLAFRNLLRGYALALPSGQAVAQALQAKGYPITAISSDQIRDIPGWDCATEGLSCDPAVHTPLFFYLMREAAVLGEGNHLGPVASAILMEVFGTMLVNCDTFLKDSHWAPDPCVAKWGGLTLADIVRYVDA